MNNAPATDTIIDALLPGEYLAEFGDIQEGQGYRSAISDTTITRGVVLSDGFVGPIVIASPLPEPTVAVPVGLLRQLVNDSTRTYGEVHSTTVGDRHGLRIACDDAEAGR